MILYMCILCGLTIWCKVGFPSRGGRSALNRPVVRGSSLGAEEPSSQIKGPQFYQKGPLLCLKRPQICHYFVEKVHNFVQKNHPVEVSGYGPAPIIINSDVIDSQNTLIKIILIEESTIYKKQGHAVSSLSKMRLA